MCIKTITVDFNGINLEFSNNSLYLFWKEVKTITASAVHPDGSCGIVINNNHNYFCEENKQMEIIKEIKIFIDKPNKITVWTSHTGIYRK